MKTIQSGSAPKPIGPYSQGIEINGFLFLSGQIGIAPESGNLADGLIEQTRQIFRNISAVLESAGCRLSDVIKSTVYIKNMSDVPRFNEVYAEFFKSDPPARSTVEVSALPRNALVEIDVIAHK